MTSRQIHCQNMLSFIKNDDISNLEKYIQKNICNRYFSLNYRMESGWGVLNYTIIHNKYLCLEILIKYGINLNNCSHFEKYPIIYALEIKSYPCVKLMMQQADCIKTFNTCSVKNITMLHIICLYGHDELLKMIV